MTSNRTFQDSEDWLRIRETNVSIRLTAITAVEFFSFCEETGHVPTSDKDHEIGYAKRFIRLNFGADKDIPFFGSTIEDAISYCEKTSLRLPTEDELRWMFEHLASESFALKWHGLCWTSTLDGKNHIALEGPYRSADGLQFGKEKRVSLDPRHYVLLESPCFRVVQDQEKG